jgi:hypothetical protein
MSDPIFAAGRLLYNALPTRVRTSTRRLRYDALHQYRRYTRAGKVFALDGQIYPYFFHGYNGAWSSERTVEVPVIRRLLEPGEPRRVLEVGNVLSHYLDIQHDVVDKYEQAPGVTNEDVVDFAPDVPYDLIVSISTLEHVGWDELPRDESKVARAVDHLLTLLAPGGRLAFTVPLGYNPGVRRMLEAHRRTWQQSYLLRVSIDNDWRQATWDEVKDAHYGQPYGCANAVAVCICDGRERS